MYEIKLKKNKNDQLNRQIWSTSAIDLPHNSKSKQCLIKYKYFSSNCIDPPVQELHSCLSHKHWAWIRLTVFILVAKLYPRFLAITGHIYSILPWLMNTSDTKLAHPLSENFLLRFFQSMRESLTSFQFMRHRFTRSQLMRHSLLLPVS